MIVYADPEFPEIEDLNLKAEALKRRVREHDEEEIRREQREADAALVLAKGCACHWSQESALPEFPAEGAPIFEKAHPMDRYPTKVISHGECCPVALAAAILEQEK